MNALKKLLLVAICILSMLCTACGSTTDEKEVADNTKTETLKIGLMPDIDSIPLLLLKKKAILKKKV